MGVFTRFWDWLLSFFWSTEMDITVVGLQNAGKTSLVRVLAGGEFTIESVLGARPHPQQLLMRQGWKSSMPTVGFNMKKVQKGHVTLKCWDIGGQPRFRTMWERYCSGASAIVFVVDSTDQPALPVAREELQALMKSPVVDGIPLLVLGNKSDLPNKLSVDDIIDALDLKSVRRREVSCYGISAKEETNLDAVLQWLVARAGK